MSTEQLTPTACLVLGLLAREGPSTPYELKRHVAATLGHFWSFPHTLLYGEPARLAGLGPAQRGARGGRASTSHLHDHAGRPRGPSGSGSAGRHGSRPSCVTRGSCSSSSPISDRPRRDRDRRRAAGDPPREARRVRRRSARRARISRCGSRTSHRRALARGDRADGPALRARRGGLLGGHRSKRRSCRRSHGPGTRPRLRRSAPHSPRRGDAHLTSRGRDGVARQHLNRQAREPHVFRERRSDGSLNSPLGAHNE